MSGSIALPTYSDEELAALEPIQLVDILLKDEDCVPLNVIEACARLGDKMTATLFMLHEGGFFWTDDEDEFGEISDGRWWLQHHAVMILGLIPSEQAGLLLLEIMHRLAREGSGMQDLVAGYWPALFQNKPDSVFSSLRAFAENPLINKYPRSTALEAAIAAAALKGGDTLEQALAWLSVLAQDEDDDWDFCLMAAGLMLHFPREQYRSLLEDIAQQYDFVPHFSAQDIQEAYEGNPFPPSWERLGDPLQFYTPDAITERMRRRIKKALREAQLIVKGETDYPNITYNPLEDYQPYVRPEPKIGRNDPCPCGSGKKYKKCCLANG